MLSVLKELSSALGKPIFLVGGGVRDAILSVMDHEGKECGFDRILSCLSEMPIPTDADICGATDGETAAKQLPKCWKVIPIHPRVGTYLIKRGCTELEYTPFRKETYGVGGGHMPTAVEFGCSIEEDALRRDFTVNALYFGSDGKLYDPLDGLKDLKNGCLRAVDKDTLAHDGLRILRMIRFAVGKDLVIDRATIRQARKYRTNLRDIAPKRIREELLRIFSLPTACLWRAVKTLNGFTSCLNAKKVSPRLFKEARTHAFLLWLYETVGRRASRLDALSARITLTRADKETLRQLFRLRRCCDVVSVAKSTVSAQAVACVLGQRTGAIFAALKEQIEQLRLAPSVSEMKYGGQLFIHENPALTGAAIGKALNVLWETSLRSGTPNQEEDLRRLWQKISK